MNNINKINMMNVGKNFIPNEWKISGKKVGNCRKISPDDKFIIHKINVLSWKKYFSAKVKNGCPLPDLGLGGVPWPGTCPGARPGSARTFPVYLGPHGHWCDAAADHRAPGANQARKKREISA
jgi:hypothetical protein